MNPRLTLQIAWGLGGYTHRVRLCVPSSITIIIRFEQGNQVNTIQGWLYKSGLPMSLKYISHNILQNGFY
jgi:hypothetical protein